MDNEEAQLWDAKETCLFLLPASFKEPGSSNMEEKEVVFVPVATDRRYIGHARNFIEQSIAYASSSEMIEKNLGPGRFHLPEMSTESNQSKLLNDVTSEELLQPVAYVPQGSQLLKTSCGKPKSTGVLLQSTVEKDCTQFSVRKTENHDIGSSNIQAVNGNNSFSSAPRQELSGSFSVYSNSEELLLPLVYDPNEYAETTMNQKDNSKANGFPLPKCANLHADIAVENVYGIDEMGFEGIVQNGSYIVNELPNENGFHINEMFGSSAEKAAIKTVNVQQASYNSAYSGAQSAYADICASNPFVTEFGVQDDTDLSTRATLFPSKSFVIPNFSELEGVTPLETSSVSGSLSDETSEDDQAAVTKDFHHALSFIAMEKTQSAHPGFGIPAKAMCILGQAEHMKEVGSRGQVQNRIQTQLSSPDLVSNLSGEPYNGSKSLKSDSGRLQKQLLRDTPVMLARKNDRSFISKDHIPSSRPTKLQSILGINVSVPAANIPSPVSDFSQNGPRSSSTLYEKLFSQVLKPSGISDSNYYTSDTEHGGNDRRPSMMQGRFDGEPVKRSSLSSSNGTPPCRMPFSSSNLGDFDKVARQSSIGKSYRSPSEATNHQKKNSHANSNVAVNRLSLRDSSDMSRHFPKELMEKYGDSIHDGSKKSPEVSPYQQFQRLASGFDSTSTATSLDQGLPFKRPKSPVKKMFSSTVEKIGRMMPAGNNANPAHNSYETATRILSGPKVSIHPADQNRLFGDLEYIIQDTANRFLLYQHSHSRLSTQSIEKTARDWRQKNRPQVTQFLYPISVQRKLVEQNLDTITFHGPLAGNATAINAIMHTWKYVAQELGVRSFCLPDAGLQHFLREATRLLELLGVTSGHMLHFQAWNNTICQTVHANYQNPYSLHGKSFE